MKKTLFRKVVLATILVFAILGVNTQLPRGIVFNRTHSLPTGLYLTNKIQPFDLSRGSIACFYYDPPTWAVDRKYLPPGYIVCKRIIAVAGDSLVSSNEKITVINGQTGTRKELVRLTKDSKGRKMPEINGTNVEKITGNQLFVAGDSYNSFDSRYTGLISSEKIIYTVEPLFTVKD